MKIERTGIHFFSATFSLPSPASDLKIPNESIRLESLVQ